MGKLTDTGLVLLAAGLSRRFGMGSKLVANYRGKPLALHAAETLVALPFAQHIAVCQAGDDVLVGLLARLGFAVVTNPDPARGQSSSVKLGVQTAKQQQAVLICLADMPLVTADHVRSVVERVTPGSIVASTSPSGGPPMPPAAFPRDYMHELLHLEGDRGAGHLLPLADRVVAPEGTLADFDTLIDFQRNF